MGDKCSQADRDRWAAEHLAEKKRKEAVDAEGGFICPDCGSTKYYDHFGPQEFMDPPNGHVFLPRKISDSTCAKCGRYVSNPLNFSAKKKRILVFVWRENRGWVGEGFCPTVACFIALGVHVHFTVFRGQHGEYLTDELEAIALCDGSCRHTQGHMEDFSKKRRDDQYMVKPIIDAALAFKK